MTPFGGQSPFGLQKIKPGPLTPHEARALMQLLEMARRPLRVTPPLIMSEDTNGIRLGYDDSGSATADVLLARITNVGEEEGEVTKFEWVELEIDFEAVPLLSDKENGQEGTISKDTWAAEIHNVDTPVDAVVLLHRTDTGRYWFDRSSGGVKVRKNSTGDDFGPRPRLNLIEGSGITLTVADDPDDDEVDVTIAATSGGAFAGARVYNNAAQAVASATTVLLAFDAERFDTDSFHDNATNNSRLTIPAGHGDVKYHVGFHVNWEGTTDADYTAELLLNGSTVIARSVAGTAAASNELATVYHLADADYLEVRVSHTHGSAINVAGAGNYTAEFWIVKCAGGGVAVRKNSAGDTFGPRPRLNFIEGSNVTLTVADDPTDGEVDITIAASGGGGGSFSGVRLRNGSNITVPFETWTELTFDTEVFDTDGYHAGGAPADIVVPSTGYYQIGACVVVRDGTTTPAGMHLAIRVRLNGASTLVQDDRPSAAAPSMYTGRATALTLATVINLSASDVLTLEAWQSNDASADGDVEAVSPYSPVFWAQKVG